MNLDNPASILDPLGWLGTAALVATIIWLLLNARIRSLAALTLLESIRRMEFQALLLFAVVLLGGMGYIVFSPGIKNLPLWGVLIDNLGEGTLATPGVTADSHQMFLAQFDYLMQSAMAFFAELFTFFMLLALGIFLINSDIQQGFLLTLLPKPLSRGEYLWGRGLGLAITVSAAWLVMGLEIFLIFAIKRPAVFGDLSAPEWKVLFCAGVLLFKWTTTIAILFLGTLRLPPIAGGFWALMLYVGGHISTKLHDLATDVTLEWTMRIPAWIGYALLPHFDRAWSAIILDPAINAFQSHADVAGFLGWSWMYTLVCGVWAWWCFRGRDL